MARKAPEHNEGLDESSLDEYGVWVKAGPEDPGSFADDSVSELLDDTLALEADESGEGGPTPFIDDEAPSMEPMAGALPAAGMNQKEQEVPDMSENNKTNAASPDEMLDIDQEISLDASDDLPEGGDDDLGGLSDLLMNIDDEQDSEDTIYLEDDDLSLDLDNTDDIELDSDMVLGKDDEGYEEEINIPGIDELNIESDDTGLDGFEDALAQLDEENLDIPAGNADDIAPATPAAGLSADLESHDIEEVGLDEFLQNEDGLGEEASFGESSAVPEMDLDDEIVIDNGLDDLSAPEAISASPEVAPEPEAVSDGLDDEIIIGDTSLDLDEDIPLDTISFEPESGIDEQDASVEDAVEQASLSALSDAGNENDIVLDEGFDDIAAVTEDFMSPSSSLEKPEETEMTISAPASPPAAPAVASAESVGVLKSIEEELHAIRSELTDLRGELKRLRDRGLLADSSDAMMTAVDSTEKLVDSLQDKAVQESSFAASSVAEEKAPSGGGFFDDEDEDETIALTGDELDNILNSAEFTEEVGESSNPDDDLDLEGQLDEPISSMEIPSESPVVFEAADTPAEAPGFEDENTSGDFPPIEEINLQEIESDDAVITDEGEDTVVDLTTGGDSAMDDNVVAAELVDDPFGGSEQAVEQMAAMDIENVLAGIEELNDNEEDMELYTGDDLDSMELDIPESDDMLQESLSPAPEKAAENSSVVPEQSTGSPTGDDLSVNLKQEIKAVLAYMDQLLESLPEEKIEEFARSEHFEVYKKLFSELGL